MKIDREKIAALAALPDDELWHEIVTIGAKHGFNMPKKTPPHSELEKLRNTVGGDKLKLGDALRILNSFKGVEK